MPCSRSGSGELFSAQPDILRYTRHGADRLDLRCGIQFDTRVTASTFDQPTHRWTVRTDRGDPISARFCVMATRCLSAARTPDFPAQSDFKGVTTMARRPRMTPSAPMSTQSLLRLRRLIETVVFNMIVRCPLVEWRG
jgi:cation diffusion facilitator CzcD-associated flavoprotein CzcO